MRRRRVLPQYGGRLLAEQCIARALVATQAVRRIPGSDRGRGSDQEQKAWGSSSGWGGRGSESGSG